jgi:hypothetical protein
MHAVAAPTWPPTPKQVLGATLARFVANAAFPRLAHRLRWWQRLGPRGLVAYVASTTLFLFTVRQWVMPRLTRPTDPDEMLTKVLRMQLNREPTAAELAELRARVERRRSR